MGHIISGHGVSTDLPKIAAMKSWLRPKTLKELRGFLGLTYYRRFIKGYGMIIKALTNLLKKNNSIWGPEAEATFESLKATMTQAPVKYRF